MSEQNCFVVGMNLDEPLLLSPNKPENNYVSYIWLSIAILFEVMGTLFMRLVAKAEWWRLPAYVCYAVSFSLFPTILQNMSVSIAYASWSACGTLGIAVVDVLLFETQLEVKQMVAMAFIVISVVMLHFA